ncbi:MAG: nucleotide-binding protein [Candidatus Omnitrophica bacterium]|nr:nucleotide-binding protein [Candidatus Omnitrophota bacterium]
MMPSSAEPDKDKNKEQSEAAPEAQDKQTPDEESKQAKENPEAAASGETPQEAEATPPETPPKRLEDFRPFEKVIPSKKILITHGDDIKMKDRVVNFMKDLKYQTVLTLDRQNAHKTMKEKFTENQDVLAVIVILSADTFVYARDGKPKDALMYADPRVIFEFGYWMGKLGRDKVFILYYDQRRYRCPTELTDPIYIPYDKTPDWQTRLCREFEKHGIPLPG